MLRQGMWMAIFLAVFSVLTACAHNEIIGRGESLEPKTGLIGRWEALEPSSGLVNILEFRPDGTSKSSVLARILMRYHIEGDKLIMIQDTRSADKETSTEQSEPKQDELSKGGEPVIDTFVLENDRLKLTLDKTGEFVELQREGQATVPNSIVGNWTFKQQTGETGHQTFYSNGTNNIRLPLPGSTEGSYEVKVDVLTVTSLDKQNSQSVKYKLEDGRLVLNDGKKITIYIRMTEPK